MCNLFVSTDNGITFRKAYASFYFLKSSLIYYPDIKESFKTNFFF